MIEVTYLNKQMDIVDEEKKPTRYLEDKINLLIDRTGGELSDAVDQNFQMNEQYYSELLAEIQKINNNEDLINTLAVSISSNSKLIEQYYSELLAEIQKLQIAVASLDARVTELEP